MKDTTRIEIRRMARNLRVIEDELLMRVKENDWPTLEDVADELQAESETLLDLIAEHQKEEHKEKNSE